MELDETLALQIIRNSGLWKRRQANCLSYPIPAQIAISDLDSRAWNPPHASASLTAPRPLPPPCRQLQC